MSDEQMSRDEAAEVIADILECTPNLRERDEAALRVAIAAIAALGGVVEVEYFVAVAEWAEGDQDIGEAATEAEAQKFIDRWDNSFGNPYHGFTIERRTAKGRILPAPPSKEGVRDDRISRMA